MMRKPIVPCVCAPHQSSGTGGTTAAASSFLTSRLPTWGPLPWVSTTSTPALTRSATCSIAAATAVSWSSGVALPPGPVMALPPRAMSVRTVDPSASGLGWPSARVSVEPRRPPGRRVRLQQFDELRSSSRATRSRQEPGSSAASGRSATIRSTTPSRSRSSERTPCAAAISGARSTVRYRIAEAPSGGSGDSQACCAQSTRSAGSSASAPPPAPSPSSRQTVGASQLTRSARHRAISPASPPSSASGGQRGPGGVDHGDQRQVELGGQPHPAPRLPQPGRAERAVAGAAAVLAEHDARRAAEPGQREQQPGVVSRPRRCRAGVRRRARRAPKQRPHPGRSGRRERPIESHAGRSAGPRRAASATARADPRARGHSTSSARAAISADVARRHDRVDEAVRVEVLGDVCTPGGNGVVVQRLVDPRAEEADQRPRFGGGDVAERAPRGEHAAGGRVAQVDEVRQAGGLVRARSPR